MQVLRLFVTLIKWFTQVLRLHLTFHIISKYLPKYLFSHITREPVIAIITIRFMNSRLTYCSQKRNKQLTQTWKSCIPRGTEDKRHWGVRNSNNQDSFNKFQPNTYFSQNVIIVRVRGTTLMYVSYDLWNRKRSREVYTTSLMTGLGNVSCAT